MSLKNVSSCYCQAIDSIIPDYGHKEDAAKNKAASREGDAANDQMMLILREAAKDAHSKGQLSEERMHVYYWSSNYHF